MILQSLSVSHWRSLLGPVALGPFSERINVIHAPNGVGKSSLFEALRRGLFDGHQVSGREIERIRPWGRELAPRVEAEFGHGGVDYRVEKGFLEGAYARLLRREGGRFVPLAESRQADSRLREILMAAESPKRGLSRPEHWGLYQALWAPHGGLALLGLTADLELRLRGQLGVPECGEGEGRLLDLLEARYATYFTAGGKFRSGQQGAPLIGMLEERDCAQAVCRDLRTKLEQFETLSRRVEDAEKKAVQGTREAEEFRGQANRLRRDAEQWQQLKREAEQHTERETNARERYQALSDREAKITTARDELKNLQATLRQSEERHQQLQADERSFADRFERARKARQEVRVEQEKVVASATRLQAAHDEVRDRERLTSARREFEKWSELESERAGLQEERSRIVAPDAPTLSKIREVRSQRLQAQAAMEAALIHVTLTAAKDLQVRSDTGTDQDLPAGETVTVSGHPEVSFEIPGVGAIRASGPETDAESFRNRLRSLDEQLNTLTEPFGEPDPEPLQMRLDAANRLEARLERSRQDIAELLRSRPPEALRQEIEALGVVQSARHERFPELADALPILSDWQAQHEALAAEVLERTNTAEADFESGRDALERSRTAVAAAAAQIQTQQTEMTGIERRLRDLAADSDHDESRQAKQQEALMGWEAARQQAEACRAKLRELPEGSDETLVQLERQLEARNQAEQVARDEANRLRGRLQALADDGVYSELVAAEERLATLEASVAREQIRMDGLKLLYDRVQTSRSELQAAVAAPLSQAASRMLRRVMGERLGTVVLSESFQLEGVSPSLAERVVGDEDLSGGELEQVYLILRLALASVLSREERELVVLDDVLNASDTGRMARMVSLFEETAEVAQIVILTCHPERYRTLDSAQFFDLEALLEAAE